MYEYSENMYAQNKNLILSNFAIAITIAQLVTSAQHVFNCQYTVALTSDATLA